MNRHLSHDEISAIIAGEGSTDASGHLQNCASCTREIEQFENVLANFRGAVRDWSDGQFRERTRIRPRWRFWPSLAYACMVALIAIVSILGYRFSGRADHANRNESDAQLLKQVNADVSRSAPVGMDTLLGFTSTETTQQ